MIIFYDPMKKIKQDYRLRKLLFAKSKTDFNKYFSLQDAHIGEEATTMLSRAKQFTEEKMGKAERTENDQAFDTLAKKTDKVKGYTEKLVKNTEAVLVPNPGKKFPHISLHLKIKRYDVYFEGFNSLQ